MLLRSSLLVLVLSNLASLLNYLNQLVLGRTLTPEDYGIFNALNAVAVIAASVFMVVPFVVARFVVKHEQQPALQVRLIDGLSRVGWVAAAGAMLALALASPLIAAQLHLPSLLPALLIALWLGTAVLVPLYSGVLNGLLLYVRSTLQLSLGQSGVRLALTLLLVVALAGTYNAAILAGVVSNGVAVVWMAWSVRGALAPVRTAPLPPLPAGEVARMARFGFPVALNWLAVGFLTNMDVVIVKHLHAPDLAGYYASAAITARIASLLPMMLLWVLFPEVAKSTQRKESALPNILVTLGLTLLASGSFALLVWLWPELVITTLFGAKYAAAARYLPTITAAMALVAVLNVLFNTCLAKSLYAYLYPTYAGLAFTAALIYFWFNSDPGQVALGLLIGCATLVVVNVGLLAYLVARPALR